MMENKMETTIIYWGSIGQGPAGPTEPQDLGASFHVTFAGFAPQICVSSKKTSVVGTCDAVVGTHVASWPMSRKLSRQMCWYLIISKVG